MSTPADDLWRSVSERLDATLRACRIPPEAVEPVTAEPGSTGLPPDPPGVRRVRRAVRIRTVPPDVDLFAVATDLWQRGGCQVGETFTGYGGTLVGQDPAGHVLSLTAGDGGTPPLLVISSPPMPRPDRGMTLGVVTGAVLGPVATCVSVLTALNSLAEPNLWAMWLWLPLLLVVGGLLALSPQSRRFGTGLLIGGAATGIATSGLCTAMMR
ncbi:hypothetical protein [Actinoplanes teichomyceticus]|uniref:Uncharacterized protein n=1 Tax=Actinoplanes teichomyceticus TaxID=1867 RepID=A0A561VIP0_ACTTI|nr:hypothetical protein [Actinoplanes teichomyceticus]TWG11486.1 hypothetical protein FHX34_106216 [Actinoplanes teichomyceticus]GIF15700.1 hypothetical protein Ate01nite_57320 [Actinoplanes teichomyceticus]